MERIVVPTRQQDWLNLAEQQGFFHHSPDDEPYWRDDAFYKLDLDQVERHLEAPIAELDGMCRELVNRACQDEEVLMRLKVPELFWPWIRESWQASEPSLYGRVDLSYDGNGLPKVLEYNAETPTALYESAVFQWLRMEQRREQGDLPPDADQYNSIHLKMVEVWQRLKLTHNLLGDRILHLTGHTFNEEDEGTLRYIAETAREAGIATHIVDIEHIGFPHHGTMIDDLTRRIDALFKLYPSEHLVTDEGARRFLDANVKVIEPWWKVVLSNKAMLALLWEMYPDHPLLLETHFVPPDGSGKTPPSGYVEKPFWGREGRGVRLFDELGRATCGEVDPVYNAAFVYQARCDLPRFETPNGERSATTGIWVIGGQAAGACFRESASPITGNWSEFVPHFFVP